MKKYSRIILAAAVVIAASSCSDKVRISGSLKDAPETDIVVKQLAGSSFKVVDALKTNASGEYSYKMKVSEGQPEFVYIFRGDTKLASLLLQKGDRVTVASDTLGNYSVEGSEESEKLRRTEKEFSAFMGEFTSALEEGNSQAASKKYIEYYRRCVRYIMENSKSMTSIPVLYQKINENFPVFSQATDAIHFRTVHDSLSKIYPDSKYVAALAREAENRFKTMNLDIRMRNATETGFPDLELPSIDGTKKKLSEVGSKVVLVYFWEAANASQKMFNQDVLLPLYKEFNPKGLEIYSVSLDTEKGVWASAVNSQKLPWINVCDGLGASSQSVILYNLSQGLPVAYVIKDGELLNESIRNEKDLRRVLSANL